MHGTIILAEDLDIYQMVPGTRTVARVSLFFLNIFLARYSLIVRFNERLLHTHTHTHNGEGLFYFVPLPLRGPNRLPASFLVMSAVANQNNEVSSSYKCSYSVKNIYVYIYICILTYLQIDSRRFQ
jgi:hypothetical protein